MNEDTPACRYENCSEVAEWRWHDGMYPGGPECSNCIREHLDTDAQLPAYRDRITTEETVTTLSGRGSAVAISAGARPLNVRFPVVRTVEALEEVGARV